MKRIIILTAVAVMSCGLVKSQTSQQLDQIHKVKNNSSLYYYGEGNGVTEKEASDAALVELSRNINVNVKFDESSLYDNGDERLSISQTISSNLNLRGYKKITYKTTDKNVNMYHAFLYYDRKEYEKNVAAEIERLRQCVFDWIEDGLTQESKVNLADALRFYNWALNMSKYYGFNEKTELTDNRPSCPWLEDKIKSMLSNITVEIDNNIGYDENDYDHYTVNGTFIYAGRPVSALDIVYFSDGENRMTRVKNGEGTLRFPDLKNVNNIKINIKYNYSEDNELDKELTKVYQSPTVDFDTYRSKSIVVSQKKDEIKMTEAKPDKAMQKEIKAVTASAPPTVEPLKDEVGRPLLTDNTCRIYIERADAVKKALKEKTDRDLTEIFTPEALKQFMGMLASGDITVTKSNDYVIEAADHYIRCSYIPVSVKNGRHSRNERIVLRFNPETKLISSVSFALTEEAENDIFRDAQWALSSRYALLKFMEDYQTAYAIRDINYINSIFNGDAVIITGKVKKNNDNYYREVGTGSMRGVEDNVEYTQYSKDEYIRHLQSLFRNRSNTYLYLVFDNAELNKAKTPSSMNEVFWIELKQHYNSSIYSDTGYLTLQIGMKDDGSQIYVRTWTPNHVPLDEMKSRYPIN